MSDLVSVTLLYTANIKGNLALLPRLATAILRERQTTSGLTLLLDLGDTCSADTWVCRATLGRAPLIVLDAIGYDAAVIGGPERAPIPPESLRRLRENAGMLTPIWGRPAQIVKRGVTVALVTGGAGGSSAVAQIVIDRTRPALPEAAGSGVMLGDVPQGTLARVDLAWPEWTVQAAREVHVESGMLPDASILAVVQLVEEEARSLIEPDSAS